MGAATPTAPSAAAIESRGLQERISDVITGFCVYHQVCGDFYQMCLNEMRAGKRKVSFNEIGARQRMRDMTVTGEGDWLSELISGIPKPHLELPGTGSGGYLGVGGEKEGGGFGCLN
jgi:hypothetical protein